jgi:hypothetical protein
MSYVIKVRGGKELSESDFDRHLDCVVEGNTFVLQSHRVGVLAGADPDVRKVLSGKQGLHQLGDDGEEEGPRVDEGGPELVVEGGRILQAEDEEVPGVNLGKMLMQTMVSNGWLHKT